MTTRRRRFLFEVREARCEDVQASGAPGHWHEYFRTDLQPTTVAMLVSVMMIFYARVVGG